MRGIDKNGIAKFSEGPVATWEKVISVWQAQKISCGLEAEV